MPNKYGLISSLAAHTAEKITKNTVNYLSFLRTAANNYKYSFRDQLLIHAQKPNATACAEIGVWNKLGRWVNRGAKGIALMVEDTQRYKLRYVFDVSDTNSKSGHKIKQWQMEEYHEDEVMMALEARFGALEEHTAFDRDLISIVDEIVEDNISDYVDQLQSAKAGSLLEELDDLNTAAWLKTTVKNSVAFMLLTRCGYDAQQFFSNDDFEHVYDFNTGKTVSVLGDATSDISEILLREIEITVRAIQREEKNINQTLANPNHVYYNTTIKKERRYFNGTDLQTGGRLSSAQSDTAGVSEGGQVRTAEEGLPSEAAETDLHRDVSERRAQQPFGGDRPAGDRDDGAPDHGNGEGGGREREPESVGSDGMGSPDEQHPAESRGNSSERPDIHITEAVASLEPSGHDFNARTDIPYYHYDAEKQELLRTCDALKNHRVTIAAYFADHEDSKERGNFIKSFYDNTYVEKILSNGQRAGYRAYDDVLTMWRGAYLSREMETFMRWESVASTIHGMMLMEQWLDPDERPLPSEGEQMTLIEEAQSEKDNAFVLPQSAIDYVLAGGSGFSEGKLRIYEQFQKGESAEDNIKFLKREYGIGGHSDAIPGTGIWEDYDGKGITLKNGDNVVLLKWPKVEKRIRELISLGRYLPEKDAELNPPKKEYRIKSGDVIWIGSKQYEITFIGAEKVVVSDLKFPLMQEEHPRESFDRMVSENPLNDRFLKEVEEAAPQEDTTEESRVDEMLSQAMFAAELSEKTGQMLFGFEEGSTKPVNIPEEETPKETAKEELAPPPETLKPLGKAAPSLLYPDIPSSQRIDYRITDDGIGVGTPLERYQHNVTAIQLLKKLESEQRFATPTEQNILAEYVGWGGLADCFDENNSHYLELKSLLTEDEYAAARESTLTAFYTPPVVIRAMYQALENMGFQRGNILEPSCGVGNFLGMKPESMSDSKIYGVELDSISGRIAQQLYQTSSIAVQGFEKTELPDSFFDVAIGNVPFGDFKVSDKRYDKHNFLIHDYFFARTLDKVRPGGIIAFVTSKGTLDKTNPNVRKYIAQRADLLGAIRLPNDTFKSAAGTEVTSDIIFLQKRDTLTAEEPDWVHLGTDANGLTMNQYFIDNPEMVLGEMREISGPFGPETACLAYEGRELGDLLSEAVQNITGSIKEYELEELSEEAEDKSIPADPSVRNFSYTLVDGNIYYRENSRMVPADVSVTGANRIKGLIGIRDCVRQLIEYQTEDYPDSMIEAEQKKLNELYDSFSAKYGSINSRANKTVFNADNSYYLLSSLEVLDDEGNFVRKADMFSKRTIKQRVAVSHVDTAAEALAISLAEKAKVDMPYMMELSGKSEEEICGDLKGVVFLNPVYGYGNDTAEKYLTADEYLSGNVREKLQWARRSAELSPEDYAANVTALEQVQPVDLTAPEISVRIGATWVPPEDYERFMFELFDTPWWATRNIKIHYSQFTGEWNIEGKAHDRSNVKANNTYGTDRINGYKIMEQTLNLKDVRIFDYVEDANGSKRPVLNKKETAIAQAKQEQIKQAFQDWIWKDRERRERLCRLYNDKFNSIRPREYDGSHLALPGMNPEISLRQHQLNAVARGLYGGNELLGHVVGAGKTYTMVTIAQESKRLGLCQKSLIVVPNHLTEQWASEYLQLYPSANILVATAKDFETKNRKRFCGRIATGDYDAVIIGHTQLEKIPLSFGRQCYYLEQQREEIMDGILEVKANHGDRFTVKQLEKEKKRIEQKLDKLNDQSRKDDVVTFEELGVDKLFVDEAHYYKNLAAFTKMRNVGGISQTEAQKSSDLYMKIRYMDELTGGRGVVFATGTPISNTMVEMYTMQKYLQYDTLKRNGLIHFDSWASTFGETVTAIELAPEGTGYRAKTRFAKFYNLPELMAMFKECADIQTADMLNLPVPKANYHTVALKPSEYQKQMVEELAKRAEKVRSGMVKSDEDNMLVITNDGRMLALDQRLINPMLPESDTGKVAACAKQVFEIWQKTSDKRSTQLVFCDMSTPRANGEFNVYDALRDKLVSMGMPAAEIAYIHSAGTEAKKKELFGKVRSGQIRVLIGSTQKMGAGTNVQQKLIAEHHLDCPWRPADLQQREGRIIRQGNENPEVDIYTYVTENTFDAYLYQLVESKQKFIGQIMTSKSPVRSAEDIDETALSYAEVKALCSGNPKIKEKMDLDVAVAKLKLVKANHLSQIYSLENNITHLYPKKISEHTQAIEGLQKDMALRDENTQPNEDGFSPMVIEGKTYAEKKAAGSALLEACKAMTSPDAVPLGQYRGFAMELYFESLAKEYRVTLIGSLRHTVSLGTDIYGNIQRMDNALENMSARLEEQKQKLTHTKEQLETAKEEVKRPFPQEDELKEKQAHLDELNIELNMDKRENEVVDEAGNEEDGSNEEQKLKDTAKAMIAHREMEDELEL